MLIQILHLSCLLNCLLNCFPFVSTPAWTAEAAKPTTDSSQISVMEKVGTVILSTNDGKIHWGDKITGEPGSKLRLRLVDQSWVLLGPFKATFERSVVSEKVVGVLRLEQGKARIQIRLGMRATQSIPVVRTPSAVMGVRGTDLMATYDPLLGESEIISFENDIDFQSVQNESHVLVHTGQWGGIGGRFGETIRAPMALPPTIVQHFKDLFVK